MNHTLDSQFKSIVERFPVDPDVQMHVSNRDAFINARVDLAKGYASLIEKLENTVSEPTYVAQNFAALKDAAEGMLMGTSVGLPADMAKRQIQQDFDALQSVALPRLNEPRKPINPPDEWAHIRALEASLKDAKSSVAIADRIIQKSQRRLGDISGVGYDVPQTNKWTR